MAPRVTVALLALLACMSGNFAPLEMEDEAVPFPANSSTVELGVRLVGAAPPSGVAASLTALLLMPGANASAAVAWGDGLVAELPGVVQPAVLSWQAGESGVRQLRLRGVLEALAATLDEGWDSAPADARLVVALVDASGADVSEEQAGTEVLLEDAEGIEGGDAGGAEPEPLFGFTPNQVAYPPDGNSSSGGSSGGGSGGSGSVPSIPVQLLSGVLAQPATLLWQLQLLTPAAAQFVPAAAMQGVLRFEPPAPGAAPQLEQVVPVPLDWTRIPAEAEYRLGLSLHGFYAARAAGQLGDVALHVFGTPNGTCPPGTALRDAPPAAASAAVAEAAAAMGTAAPADEQAATGGGAAPGVADLSLSVNGSVIDLSSAFQPWIKDYGAQVEEDVANVTLCLRRHSDASSIAVAVVRSSSGSSSGRSSGGKGSYLLQPVDGDSALDIDEICDCSAADLTGNAAPSDEASSTSDDSSSDRDGGSSCGYTAWQLPLAAGQNRFNITLREPQANGSTSSQRYSLAVVRLSPPDHAGLASITVRASNGSSTTLCGNSSSSSSRSGIASLDLGVEAELMSIKRNVVSLPAPLPPPPCEAGSRLALNVSEQTQLVSLRPALLHPELPGVRVEVNGRVLSRGGDVAADRIADTAGQVQGSEDSGEGSSGENSSSNSSSSGLLPSAFILGMQPGTPIEVAVVVIAEDGVTSARYPITITRLPTASAAPAAASKGKMLSKSSSSSVAGPAAAPAAAPATAPPQEQDTDLLLTQQRLTAAQLQALRWPLPPALQLGCSPCPAGWAAAGLNASQCIMCPPGTYSAAAQSRACTPCKPGTYAYSWGSTHCKHCITQTYAAAAGSALCAMCPSNLTTAEDGSAACDVPLDDDAAAAAASGRRAAVVVSFSVLLSGVDWEDVVLQAGVAASPDAVVASLVAADTASAFNVTLQSVRVQGVARVAARMLTANVTASIGVELPPGASQEELAAALEVQRLSADAPIAMLASDPDKFFGRTTKALEVTVESVGAATVESRIDSGGGVSKWALIVPCIAGVVAGSLLVYACCRRSKRCAAWRRSAADWYATTPLAPRSTRYSRYAS